MLRNTWQEKISTSEIKEFVIAKFDGEVNIIGKLNDGTLVTIDMFTDDVVVIGKLCDKSLREMEVILVFQP